MSVHSIIFLFFFIFVGNSTLGNADEITSCIETNRNENQKKFNDLFAVIEEAKKKEQNEEGISEFDSFYIAKMSRISAGVPSDRKEFEVRFQNPAENGITWEQLKAAEGLLNEIEPGSLGVKNLSTSEIMKKVSDWSKNPKHSKETQIYFLSLYGSALAKLYDHSGKTKSSDLVMKEGGGQCTEIHEVLGRIGESLSALGLKAIPTSGLLWGKGNHGGLHGLMIFEDQKNGKYYLQNYSQVVELEAGNLAEAQEMVAAYIGPFSNSIVVGGGSRPRVFLPRTAAWYGTMMRQGVEQKPRTIQARIGMGSGNEYEVTIKPYGNTVVGVAKSGDFEIIYAGLTGSGTTQSGSFALKNQYFAGYTRTTAPDFFSENKSQSRDGLSLSAQVDATYDLQKNAKQTTKLEAGSFMQVVGFREFDLLSKKNRNTQGINSGDRYIDSYLGVSTSIQSANQDMQAKIGLYREFKASQNDEQLRTGESSFDVDFSDVFKTETTFGKKDSREYTRIYGQLRRPSGGDATGIQWGVESNRGNLSASVEGSRFFSQNEPFYRERDWAFDAALSYSAPIQGQKGSSFEVGVAHSNREAHPDFRGRDSFSPGVFSQRGTRLFANFTVKVDTNRNKKVEENVMVISYVPLSTGTRGVEYEKKFDGKKTTYRSDLIKKDFESEDDLKKALIEHFEKKK